MAAFQSGRHHEGDGGQGALVHVAIEIAEALQVLRHGAGHHARVGHQRIAEVVVVQQLQHIGGHTREVGGHKIVEVTTTGIPLPTDGIIGQQIGDGRRGLRREGIGGGAQGLHCTGGAVGQVVIVHQIIRAGRALGRAAFRCQQRGDGGYTGLGGVGAINVGATAVAVLREEIVGARLRIGVFDLVGGRRGQTAVDVVHG